MTKYKEIKIDVKVSPEIIINEMLKNMYENNKKPENDVENKKQ